MEIQKAAIQYFNVSKDYAFKAFNHLSEKFSVIASSACGFAKKTAEFGKHYFDAGRTFAVAHKKHIAIGAVAGGVATVMYKIFHGHCPFAKLCKTGKPKVSEATEL